MTQRAG